ILFPLCSLFIVFFLPLHCSLSPNPSSPSTRRDPPRPCPLFRPPLTPIEAALVPDKDVVEGDLPVDGLLKDVRGDVERTHNGNS
ncbi:hypothetical protein CRG98_050222, partial [Punica granatum]